MNQAYTYRKDKNYIEIRCWGIGGVKNSVMRMHREKVVSNFWFLFYRVQFWRFKKWKNFNKLEEREWHADFKLKVIAKKYVFIGSVFHYFNIPVSPYVLPSNEAYRKMFMAGYLKMFF